ncbi:uncharacterized protein CANTADRAFT_8523 [Suhomyces tanzawaensis NRRL Y-17324]|uniref:CID domain-containing protein n=1 Tax=Suhomyces tanzawaensis NRRL Y-17324 TaxID=984487 RepID=A0A1E4SAU6_9ASCO|nr:uncharacterized protein CANTADRAFT_8523 [Suhomyces tanzawaensis NRRL Y-17324]ODV76629.1 hypothetical protein CANTADRAFT_8523 [Suhomyces tanzawaensis NRRL Y-17324]
MAAQLENYRTANIQLVQKIHLQNELLLAARKEETTASTMDEFNPDFYQKQLASLTINSRAVITDLTNIAERNVDKCNEICEMIETRIKKCLPQHKLNAMYLLDSICKNVGNPYNVIFGKNLFKTFTETYSIVTDTPTRQHLINLFKTWINAKTNTGSELFPQPILGKIEKFIIQATSINGSTPPPTTAGPGAVSQKFRLAPDWLMKEGRSLLLLIIKLNQGAEYLLSNTDLITEEDVKSVNQGEAHRNTLVSMINETLDGIMFDMRGSDADSTPTMQFEANVKKYHANFQNVRKDLEEQVIKEETLMKKVHEKLHAIKLKQELKQKLLAKRSKIREFIAANKVLLNAKPNPLYFTNITQDIKANPEIVNFIQSWGKIPVVKAIPTKPQEPIKPTVDLSLSLGMNFGSFNFLDSILSNGVVDHALEPKQTVEVPSRDSSSETEEPANEPVLEVTSDKIVPEVEQLSDKLVPEVEESSPNLVPEFKKVVDEETPVEAHNAEDFDSDDGIPQSILNTESDVMQEEDEDEDAYDPPLPPVRSPSPEVEVALHSNEPASVEDEEDDYEPTFDGETSQEKEHVIPQMQYYMRTGTGMIPPRLEALYNMTAPGIEPRRPSILKRKASDGARVVKRVRFDI